MKDILDLQPSPHTQLALFDFDGTLVKAKEGRPHPLDVDDWEFRRSSVPTVLREFATRYRLVIVTDQSKPWKVDQIRAVMTHLGISPTLLIAGSKEHYKPATVLFDQAFPRSTAAFYVGDAAGRPQDWSDCDKVFAERIGAPFRVPEEVFPLAFPPPRPIPPVVKKEVVILVGCPASGKTTVAKTLTGYHRVDGDLFKTVPAMLKDARAHVAASSIVFDCTGSTKKKRAEFIQFAKDHGLPVRILWVTTSMETSMEQNKERAYKGYAYVPPVAFYVYRKNLEPPTEEEGTVLVLS
jgi:bifunctional polynucleotide phosphatase/kinase